MSDTSASLRRKMLGAGDLLTVVSTMKVMAAANIVQYEKSVAALGDYYRTVEIGLCACLRQRELSARVVERKKNIRCRCHCVRLRPGPGRAIQ